ncbi:hypothetical protein ACFFQF_02155 [Haladaptatus pallidirubidus]|uniref:DUF8134 domain-containing protein n=1 Tax=Haladaptatus pallidirubidus TaxID=1008152 RepID=A0AAV3UAL6_9EURY|nr:hypothetical protein [Haladaptatus pallidirubidus]
MVIAVRTLDEGAWVNVNNTRIVGVSNVWKLARHDICDCGVAFFVVEVFTDVGVDGRRVEARAGGQCIGCGERGTTGWLQVGKMGESRFRSVAVEGVHSPK